MKQIDPCIKGRARDVELGKCFLSSRLDMNQLLFIPNNMNTYVRNALTHNTFYIEDRKEYVVTKTRFYNRNDKEKTRLFRRK